MFKTANNDNISHPNSRPKLPFPGNGKGNLKLPWEGKGNLRLVFPGVTGNGNSRSPLTGSAIFECPNMDTFAKSAQNWVMKNGTSGARPKILRPLL